MLYRPGWAAAAKRIESTHTECGRAQVLVGVVDDWLGDEVGEFDRW